MTTLFDVRRQMGEAIETTGLSCSAYEYDTINPPVAHVLIGEFDPRLIFSGSKAAYPFKVRAFFPRIAERAQLQQLDELKALSGAGSLIEAVQNSDNWGSVDVDYAQVVSVGQTIEVEVASNVYLMAEFDVEVLF